MSVSTDLWDRHPRYLSPSGNPVRHVGLSDASGRINPNFGILTIVMVRYSLFLVAVALAGAGCTSTPPVALERLVDARQLSSDLLLQFSKASDAANLSVMADTDEASLAYARSSESATTALEKDREVLTSLLSNLGYSNESRLLEEFTTAFADYRTLDGTILSLAIENSNLKAQRLSFGASREAADAFTTAAKACTPASAEDRWHVSALVASAIADVREIQALQAPHIAEADTATMAKLESQMSAAEASARSALKDLGTVVSGPSRQQVATASTFLDRFMGASANIVALSHRNSNVRSLALSLGQKRTLIARCEEVLQSLQAALAARQLGGTR